MATLYDYEVSFVGAERKWPFAYARLEDTTPEVGHAAAVLSRVVGTQLTGVVLSLDAANSKAVLDVTPGKIINLQVRNVLTYAGAVEATWGSEDVGSAVFYDRSSTMPSGVELSTSPLDKDGVANPLFGHIAPKSDADAALYPKGGASASTQQVGVIMRGAGG